MTSDQGGGVCVCVRVSASRTGDGQGAASELEAARRGLRRALLIRDFDSFSSPLPPLHRDVERRGDSFKLAVGNSGLVGSGPSRQALTRDPRRGRNSGNVLEQNPGRQGETPVLNQESPDCYA